MAKFTLYRNGELVAVTTDEGVERFATNKGIDLKHEGRRVTKQELADWKKARFLELMTAAVSENKKTHKTAQAAMMRQVNARDDGPIVGSFKPLSESKAFASWLARFENMLPKDKLELLKRRLWLVLTGGEKRPEDTVTKDTGNRDMFLEVLSVVLTSPDPIGFMNAAFSLSVAECADLDEVEVPEALRPLFDVCSNVDGRGEVLATFLFHDVVWVPGTGRHDMLGHGKSAGNWHVKENIGSKARMGSNHYATSEICSRMLAEAATGDIVTEGFADIRHSISKSFIDANQAPLDALCKKEGGIYEALNVAFRASEAETRGIIFFKRNSLVVRRITDTQCIGSTKGDFVVRPNASVQASIKKAS